MTTRISANNGSQILKVESFEVINFQEHNPQPDGTVQVRQVILIYALAEDGNLYEFSGRWVALPIERAKILNSR